MRHAPAPSAVEILELADWAEARGRRGVAELARAYVDSAIGFLARGSTCAARFELAKAAEELS